VQVSAKRTNPPKPFTEDTLLAAMLNAGREAGDGDDAKMLRKVSGIGTPATRAAILETLQTREYLALTKGKGGAVFKSTIKGQELIRHAPSDLANVSITAQLERDLQDIDQAASDSDACRLRDEFVGRQIGFVTNHISTIIKTMESAPPGNENRSGGSGKPTAKMIEYVRSSGKRVGVDTADAETSVEAAKRFIDQHKEKNNPPTAKMIAFAEKLAKENGVEVSDDVRS